MSSAYCSKLHESYDGDDDYNDGDECEMQI